jgi:NitT/TauT family transport system substrate-binding protein
MGCIVVSKQFANEHPVAIENFLKEYKASIEYMSDVKNIDKGAELVVKAGISDDPAVAKSALSNLGEAIAYVD